MKTKGLGAGSYPMAPEQETRTITGTIYVSYKFETEVPTSWTDDDIYDDIRTNLNEYINFADETIEEVEM